MSSIDDCLPPAILRNRAIIRESLEKALSGLPEELTASFENDLTRSAHGSVTRWLFQMILLHAGFAHASLLAGSVTIFAYGIQTDWESMPTNVWNRVDREFAVGEMTLTFVGWLPADVKQFALAAMDSTILVHAENVFLNSHGLREKNLQNVFGSIERDTRPILEELLKQGTAVTLTHFLFQDLRVYFSLSGEYRSEEIMDSIQRTIKEHLKASDHIFRLSPLSYIVISPGADSEQIKGRFKTIYVQIKSLVLDYDLRMFTIRQLPLRFTQIWSQLL